MSSFGATLGATGLLEPQKRPLVVEILHARGLRDADMYDMSDPYCTVMIEKLKTSKKTTSIQPNTLDPEWYEYLPIPEYCFGQTLVFRVMDSDSPEVDTVGGDQKDDLLGFATLTADRFPPNSTDVLTLELVGGGQGFTPELKVKVYDAHAAPDMFVDPETTQAFQGDNKDEKQIPVVQIMRSANLRNADAFGKSDPYCTLSIGDDHNMREIGRTTVQDDTLNPEWYEDFAIEDYEKGDKLIFKIYDEDGGKEHDDLLGLATLDGSSFLPLGLPPVDLPLVGTGMGIDAVLKVRVGFTTMTLRMTRTIEIKPEIDLDAYADRPDSALCKALANGDEVSYEDLINARLRFEGADASLGEIAKRRLREHLGARKSETEVERFLQRMRDKGEGSITIAWRRFFDADGDGELSFGEFCNALVDFEWKGDVVKLWHALGRGAKELSLEMLDHDGAEILDTFTNWCIEQKGGPYEVFKSLDDDGSDSLDPEEFVQGLEEMGFFQVRNLPSSLVDGPSVLKNLYPLLDQGGLGCVQGEQVLFLEKDKKKRARILKERARIKEFGQDAMLEPLTSGADTLLHQLYIDHTPLGGKSFKMLRGNAAWQACGEGEKPRRTWRVNGGPLRRGDAREATPFELGHSRSAWPKTYSKHFSSSGSRPLSSSVSLPRLHAK